MKLNKQDFDSMMAFIMITFICAALLACVLMGFWSMEGCRNRWGAVTTQPAIVEESSGNVTQWPEVYWTADDYRKQYAALGLRFEDSSHWYMVYGPGARQ